MAENPSKKRRIDYKDSFLQFFVNQKRCDVTFACKDATDQWKTIGAHKFLLISVSDVFDTMFYGESVKKFGVRDEKAIKITDINMEAFKLFLG